MRRIIIISSVIFSILAVFSIIMAKDFGDASGWICALLCCINYNIKK